MNGRIDPVRVQTQVHMEMVLERDRMIRGLKAGIVVLFVLNVIQAVWITILITRS